MPPRPATPPRKTAARAAAKAPPRDLAAAIAARILAGEFAPGSVLPRELDLSAEMGAGRQAVREAIRTLSAKGMVESRKRAGTRVRPAMDWLRLDEQLLNWQLLALPREQLVRDVLDMRRIVEPAAAELAARQAGDEDIARIERAYRTMEAASGHDARAYADADLLFHRAILMASRNSLLESLAGFLTWALKASFSLSSSHPGAPFRSLPAHRAVLDAVWRRAPEDAKGAMLALIETANERIRTAQR